MHKPAIAHEMRYTNKKVAYLKLVMCTSGVPQYDGLKLTTMVQHGKSNTALV